MFGINITKTVSNIRYPNTFTPSGDSDTFVSGVSVIITFIDAYRKAKSYIIFASWIKCSNTHHYVSDVDYMIAEKNIFFFVQGTKKVIKS